MKSIPTVLRSHPKSAIGAGVIALAFTLIAASASPTNFVSVFRMDDGSTCWQDVHPFGGGGGGGGPQHWNNGGGNGAGNDAAAESEAGRGLPEQFKGRFMGVRPEELAAVTYDTCSQAD